ncbi:MAG: RagB/SusD family nutrient uptake outer membrane protein [Bacteroidales bacterium]|nr:RagB/SusD family nutrient uptake outer membrane protein [Bacteroidales bacterium]
MKSKLLYIMLAAVGLGATSCLESPLPQTDNATADQVAKADKEGLVNGLTQYLNTPIADYDDVVYTGIGYPEHIIWHDVMTANTTLWSTSYNYWTAYTELLYTGNWAWMYYYWVYYQYIVYKAALVIQNCDPESVDDALYLATGLSHRAFAMFDMARMYEFFPTGTSLDASYYPTLKGLTVPIVTEYTTEEQAKANPRAPFYKMYRFILNDLQGAEEAILKATASGAKNYASEGMIYGLAARFWLELGSRFTNYPDDLAEQISHDNDQWEELGEAYQDLPAIGITTANEAFEKAATYARKAINSGYTVLSQDDWYNTSTGYNSANSSWIWGILMSSSDKMVTYYTWESWASFMCPEASWGVSSSTYKATFLIDADLFSKISDSDWRKLTWIDPADWVDDNPTPDEEEEFEKRFNSKYADKTLFSFEEWSQYTPYVGFKFHPGSGNTTSSTTGNKMDIPLMRVEEMYYIEAEAIAHTQGVAAGATALASFTNTYRYTDGSYKCTASSMEDFQEALFLQKSIEFWGEGVILYDMKRWRKAITRGYSGSNHPTSYQFNSIEGYVAPWTILYIPLNESYQNQSLVLNPDPAQVSEELRYLE